MIAPSASKENTTAEKQIEDMKELNKRLKSLFLLVGGTFVLPKEAQEEKEKWLDRKISDTAFQKFLYAHLEHHVKTHPMFHEIEEVIREYYLRYYKTCQREWIDKKINEKVFTFLSVMVFNKQTEYWRLYKGSYSGKPMVTRDLVM